MAITDLTTTTLQQTEASVVAGLLAAHPNLDLRSGTVLRELLARPLAGIVATNDQNYTDLLNRLSLTAMQAAGVNDPVAIDRLLENLGLKRYTGSAATGTLLIRLDTNTTTTVSIGNQFLSPTGGIYTAQSDYTLTVNPIGAMQLPIVTDAGGYYALVPAQAQTIGLAGVLSAGTAFQLNFNWPGVTSVTAYTAFASATDPETLDQLIVRASAGATARNLTTPSGIQAMLTDPGYGNFTELTALSCQGMGSPVQFRDKHGPHGIVTGGRIDVYVRTFTVPYTLVISKPGNRQPDGTYTLTLEPADAPGLYTVDGVIDAGSVTPVLGSYEFTETRSGLNNVAHDIDPDNAILETAYTAYQRTALVITGVNATSPTHLFGIRVTVAPRLGEIQAYVDRPENFACDVLIRCPLICKVQVKATVLAARAAAVTVDQLVSAVVNCVNSRSFVKQLSQAEIIAALYTLPISRVESFDDVNVGFELRGQVRDAAGTLHNLSGTALAITGIENPAVLLTPATCVFACTPSDVTINLRYE